MKKANTNKRAILALAIHPNTFGVGYAVFEGDCVPIDWGRKVVGADRSADSFEHVRVLLHIYQPDILVFEDCRGKQNRRSGRIKKLLAKVKSLATRKNIPVLRYSRVNIRECFAPYGARTKDEIARTIAQLFPEFVPLVPPSRKPWQSEHHHMGIFDAIALAFTYYAKDNA